MNLRLYRRCAVLALLSAGLLAAQARYILETAPAADIGQVSSLYGLTVARVLASGEHSVYLVTSPGSAPSPLLLEQVRADASVRQFEPDQSLESAEAPSHAAIQQPLDQLGAAVYDPTPVSYFGAAVRSAYVNQTVTGLIRLSEAQARFGTGTGIVAVIDTGVDPHHPALANSLLPGYDFTRDLPGTASEWADLSQSTVALLDQSTTALLDGKSVPVVLSQSTVALLDQSTVALLDGQSLPASFGHGTMIAGLIHLVAPTALIMPLKAFQADGSSRLSDIIRAVYYAADHGAKVINMSFTLSTPSPELAQALGYAAGRGAICVASVGNTGREVMDYPAGFSRVVGVGSTNALDLRSPFSNYGASSARTSAPGEAIVTTYPGGHYAGAWGTSFSTALVSGAVAVMAGIDPSLAFSAAADALDHGDKIEQGMGDARLDIYNSALYYATNR